MIAHAAIRMGMGLSGAVMHRSNTPKSINNVVCIHEAWVEDPYNKAPEIRHKVMTGLRWRVAWPEQTVDTQPGLGLRGSSRVSVIVICLELYGRIIERHLPLVGVIVWPIRIFLVFVLFP